MIRIHDGKTLQSRTEWLCILLSSDWLILLGWYLHLLSETASWLYILFQFSNHFLLSIYVCRVGALPVQRRAADGGFAAKPRMKQQQQLRQEDNAGPKQRPQTLDSLFANMKEQRMKAFSPPNNGGGRQLNGGGRGGRPRVPWARGRFGN